MEEAGIIERLTGPTEWCAAMLPVQKSNRKLSICVDLRKLNSAVKLPEIVQCLVIDMLKNEEGCEEIMDDIIVFEKSAEEHDENLKRTLQVIKESGLKLNKEKCGFKKDRLTYFGHVLSADGVSPDPRKVEAITELPAPRFIPNLATVMQPMTDPLKSDRAWTWGPSQQEAFVKVKQIISTSTVLAFYDPKKNNYCLCSGYGIGGVLMQGHGDQLCPVTFSLRTLTQTEVKYAQIEKACLAAAWTCQTFSRYLVGLSTFKLLTDHKPLVPLINQREISTRHH